MTALFVARHRSAMAIASLLLAGASTGQAQSLERRVLATVDGDVQFTFAARRGVCGDGATFIEDGLGGESRIYENGNFSGRGNHNDFRACVPGPVRVVVWIADGEIIRLRTYAGPPPASPVNQRRDIGLVSVADAVSFLKTLAERGNSRASEQAVLPLVLADSTTPWPILLQLARQDDIGRSVRRSAAFWLSRGAAAKLGVADADPDSEDDVRSSAVFALSQQPRNQSVPQLIEIARTSKRPAVRGQALFWLGQAGDPRAIDLFAEILGVR